MNIPVTGYERPQGAKDFATRDQESSTSTYSSTDVLFVSVGAYSHSLAWLNMRPAGVDLNAHGTATVISGLARLAPSATAPHLPPTSIRSLAYRIWR